MIVCQCRVVTGNDVAAAVDQGACTLGQLCRTTGAGQDCGRCVFSLRRLMCQDGETAPDADLVEVEHAAG